MARKARSAQLLLSTPRELLVDRYCELQPQLQRRLNALLHGEVREELHAVTEHQRVVLTVLRGQSVTMRELAKQLEVGESAATAVVDRLVRQGLVVRHDDPSDRRVVRLELSDEGLSVVTALRGEGLQQDREPALGPVGRSADTARWDHGDPRQGRERDQHPPQDRPARQQTQGAPMTTTEEFIGAGPQTVSEMEEPFGTGGTGATGSRAQPVSLTASLTIPS